MSSTDTYLHVEFFFFFMTNSLVLQHMTFPSLKLRVFVCLLRRDCLDPPAKRERTETSAPWWDLNCCGFFSLPVISTFFPRTRGRGGRLCCSFWRSPQCLLSLGKKKSLENKRIQRKGRRHSQWRTSQHFVLTVFYFCLLLTCSLDDTGCCCDICRWKHYQSYIIASTCN